MDYLNKRTVMANKMMLTTFGILVLAIVCCECYGFDSGASCTEKTARRGRAQLMKSIPCDLSVQAYCNLPGSMYPWNAVRRFVSENQGMMKRMYGDVRHISVLRNEINNNDITLDDVEETAKRYSRAGWKRNKYLHQELSKTKNNDLLSEAHYRRNANPHLRSRSTARTTMRSTQRSNVSPASASIESETSTPSTLATATATSTTVSAITNKPKPIEKREKMASLSAKQTRKPSVPSSGKESEYEEAIEAAIEEIVIQFNGDNNNNLYANDTDQNANDKIRTETTTDSVDGNIQIIGAPDLSVANNKSEPAPTISTTLRIYGFSKDEKATTTSTPIVYNTTESSSAKADELIRVEETSTTAKTQLNDNFIQIEIDEPETPNDPEDSLAVESIQTESIIITDDIDKDKLDKIPKPFDDQAAGQLYQDVAEKEDPVFPSSRGVNACPVKEEVVAPFWANNTRGEVLALLNLYPFEQYVHWEKCTQEHKQMYCRDGCRCEQQYRLHRLLAYDPHNECRGIFSDWFRFPSCCICKCYNIPFEYRVTSRSPRSMNRNRFFNGDRRRAEKLSNDDTDENDETFFSESYRKEAYSNDDNLDEMMFVDDDMDF